MKGLRLFSRTSDSRAWSLASYHSPHSLTWSWSLSFLLFRGDEKRWGWPLGWLCRYNTGWQLGIRVPFAGILYLSRQHAMWFRDMWLQKRNEEIKNGEWPSPRQVKNLEAAFKEHDIPGPWLH